MTRLKLEVEIDSIYDATLVVAGIGRSPEVRKNLVEGSAVRTFDSLFTSMRLVKAEVEDRGE